MERFHRALVRHPKRVMLLFLLATGISLLCWPLVSVNYDMNDYLPPRAPPPSRWTRWERNTRAASPTPVCWFGTSASPGH